MLSFFSASAVIRRISGQNGRSTSFKRSVFERSGRDNRVHPVSSTGHLILAGDLIGFDGEKAKAFEVFIPLGAILSVLWQYREKFVGVIKVIPGSKDARSFAGNIFIVFLPAAFIGLLMHMLIKTYLFNPVSFFLGFAYYHIVSGLLVLAFYWQKGWKF